MSTAPTGSVNEVTEYLDRQLNYISGLKQLGMTAEQLATNALLLKLPEELGSTLRNGLRLRRRGRGQDDFKFTPDELRDVMNDTVMTWGTTAPMKAAATTCSQTAMQDSEVQNKRIEVKSTHDIRTSNGNQRDGARGGFGGRGYSNNRGFGRGYPNNQGFHRGNSNSQGFGRGNFNSQSFHRGNSIKQNNGRGGNRRISKPTCQVCQEQTHYTPQCLKYPDPQSKKAKLIERGMCQDCTRPKHEGKCKLNRVCYSCEGWHMSYLCPNFNASTTK